MRQHARKPWFQRWATRRQARSGVWRPGTLGYSPSLHMLDEARKAAVDFQAMLAAHVAEIERVTPPSD